MNQVEILVKRIEQGESPGVLSCGEQIAAALLFNKLEWLPPAYAHVVDAIDRLGDNWLQMVIDYRRRNQ